MRTRRIAIAAGGTAGHVYPALAVADAYREAVLGIEVLFLGNSTGFEAELVKRSGYRFHTISASPLIGGNLRAKASAVANVLVSCVEARRILKMNDVEAVLGFGSYVSGGAILAARSLRIKTAIHESNIRAGIANRLLGPIVDRIYLGFEASPDSSLSRAYVTGNPVRPDVAVLFNERRQPPVGKDARILVTGGSLGSAFLNRNVPELMKRLVAQGFSVQVRHQTGSGAAEAVSAAYRDKGINASVREYIDDMASAYRWANFAITCAGAATMAELAIAGLPALFVPLSWAAHNHQVHNAVAFTNRGGGYYVEESTWEAEPVASRIATLLGNSGAWLDASSAMRRLAQPSASDVIVADCEALSAGAIKPRPSKGARAQS